MIIRVSESEMMQAAIIHSVSWKASHMDICSPEFIELHTPERQYQFLKTTVENGAELYMLIEYKPIGIVSINKNIIENLYVLPDEHNKGYGTKLLMFAVDKCEGDPSLWILNTNEGAKRLYERNGFRPTGNIVKHKDGLYELELSLKK